MDADLTVFAGSRIGLLGGTFDPVHHGHLAMALAAHQRCRLDRVVFLPAASPPHKPETVVTPLVDRLVMLRLAIESSPFLFCSDIEAFRSGPSYTIDTLRHLRAELGPEAELFFIIGADSFLEITTWKEYRRIPFLAHLVVVNRPECPAEGISRVLAQGFSGFVREDGDDWCCHGVRGGIVLVEMAPVGCSSTAIRGRVGEGKSLAGLVPAAVAGYIEEHGLYR